MVKHPFKGRKGRLEVVTTVRGEDGTDAAATAANNAAAAELETPQELDDETPELPSAPVKAKIKPVAAPNVPKPIVPAEPKPLKTTPKSKRAEAATVPQAAIINRRRG